jgi:hypothetical protein
VLNGGNGIRFLHIALMVLLFAGEVFAADRDHRNCYCRANEQQYSQGQVLCLFGKLARCEMNLNNPSWKIIAPTCPESRSKPSSKFFAQALPPAK